jgi:hypothetical protein
MSENRAATSKPLSRLRVWIALASFVAIMWFGLNAIEHIQSVYNWHCSVDALETQGYCDTINVVSTDGHPGVQKTSMKINNDTALLRFIVLVAAIAFPFALISWWAFVEKRAQRDEAIKKELP